MTPPPSEPPQDRESKPARRLLRRVVGALITSAVLLLALGYIALALGLGQGLTPLIRTALWAGAALVAAGFVAAVAGKRVPARIAQGLVVAIAIGATVAEGRRIAEINERSVQVRRQKNEVLLANALVRVPCRNGDIATLQMTSREQDDFHSMSIQIVPADRNGFSDLLLSAHGRDLPPKDDRIREYRLVSGTDCSSTEYPSLDAMFRRIVAHYEKERPKYESLHAGRDARRGAPQN